MQMRFPCAMIWHRIDGTGRGGLKYEKKRFAHLFYVFLCCIRLYLYLQMYRGMKKFSAHMKKRILFPRFLKLRMEAVKK